MAWICANKTCGTSSEVWTARCPQCGGWKLVEEGSTQAREVQEAQAVAADRERAERAAAAREARARAAAAAAGESAQAQATPIEAPELSVVNSATAAAAPHERISSGIAELDRVLGGGLVVGSIVLIGGDPGIGKSTLLAQALLGWTRSLSARDGATRVLYASGEESAAQISARMARLSVADQRIGIAAEEDVDAILANARKTMPGVLVVDSIQTVKTDEASGYKGSVVQVRECASRLATFAKETGTPVILIGHVTKDGGLGGPKTLEHLVDAILQIEADDGGLRVLRAHKNRYGSTDEIGLFEMTAAGLAEVGSPSLATLSERVVGQPGSIITAIVDGNRPQLVEIQALVSTPRQNGDGNPVAGKRSASGVSPGRLELLLAVLQRHGGVDVWDRDVYVNVVGGRRIVEPAIDLAIACAIASSARNIAIHEATLAIGELGLTGELRSAPKLEARLAEAARMGFELAIVARRDEARACHAFAGERRSVAIAATLAYALDIALMPPTTALMAIS